MFHIPNRREETSERMNKASVLKWGWQGCAVEEEGEVHGFTNVFGSNCPLENTVIYMCMAFFGHFIFMHVHIHEVLLIKETIDL